MIIIMHFQVTVDSSPPRPGVVNDSHPGEPDRDFQRSLHLHAHWEGFFDHESGILFYKYGLSMDNKCLSLDFFSEENEQVRQDIHVYTNNAWLDT